MPRPLDADSYSDLYMRYLRYRWTEDRGDEHADWGGSWWHFEVDVDGNPVRQVERYDNGVRLRYGPDHSEDEFGRLAESIVANWDQRPDHNLSAEDFEALWRSGPWHNAAC